MSSLGIDRDENYKNAFKLNLLARNLELKARARIGLGHLRHDQADNYGAALRPAEGIGNENLHAQALVGLGKLRIDSRENFSEALELGRSLEKPLLQLQPFMGLGNAKVRPEFNYDHALRIAIAPGEHKVDSQANYERAAWAAEQAGDRPTQCRALMNSAKASRNPLKSCYLAVELAKRMTRNDLIEQATGAMRQCR